LHIRIKLPVENPGSFDIMVRLSGVDINNYSKVLEYKTNYSSTELITSSTDLQPEELQSDTSNNQHGKIIHKLNRKQRILTDEDIDQIIVGYKSGLRMNELARKFNCHECTIRYKLRAAGINNYKPKLDDDQIAKMVELYQSGLSLDDVGRKVGVSRETVRKYIKAKGAEIRNVYK
jgi:DNA invertase Pin-like site-specific DNA recombinase